MIKAICIDKAGEASIVLLGLSEGNIELLKAGKPIVVDLKELGGSGTICISYGKTEADILVDLQKAGLLPAQGATQN